MEVGYDPETLEEHTKDAKFCALCRGINIVDLASPGGYSHVKTIADLASHRSRCSLCHKLFDY